MKKNIITAEGVGAVINAAKEDCEALKGVYGSESVLLVGFQSRVSLQGDHNITVDEPTTMPGGQNKGPNPLDLMCASLGTCQEITYKMYATAMGLDVDSVSAEIVGDINLNGLVGNGGPVAFKNIKGKITLVSSESEEKLRELKKVVDAHCPLLATLKQSVPINLELTYKGVEEKTCAKLAEKDPVQREGLLAVIGAGKEDANALAFKYQSTSELSSDTLMTKVDLPLGHKLVVDEPTTMPGGNNEGPNPLDVFCASLGTCQEITWKMYATVMGIPVSKVSASVKAPIDLRGLVGLADDAVPFDKISASVTVCSSAPKEKIEALKAAVDSHCPLVKSITEKIPVDLELICRKPSAAPGGASKSK